MQFDRGDVVRLRKPHACGENRWEVVRLGADIGLRCLQCGHRIMLARSELERRITAFVVRAGQPVPELEPARSEPEVP